MHPRGGVLLVGLLAFLASGCWSTVEVSEEFETEVVLEPAEDFPEREDVPAGPSPFAVSSGQATVESAVYTTCWSHGDAALCADGFAQPDRTVLAATDTVTVTFDGTNGQLTAAWSTGVDAEPLDLEVSSGDEGGWTVDLSVVTEEEYVLWLSWIGDEGDAHTAMTIRRGA